MDVPPDTDSVLRELHAEGFSALGCEIAGLQPQKICTMPDVLRLQQRYVCELNARQASAVAGAFCVQAPLKGAHAVPVQVTFDVVQAPSSFSLPIMQRRCLDPPFQVRMTYRSSLPLQFPVTASVHAVDEAALPSLHAWSLPSEEQPNRQLSDAQQERAVLLLPLQRKEAGDGKWSHGADVIFTFNRLQFRQPSQVRPRWLLFAGTLLGGGYTYSVFKVPTVVMSRMSEQFDKAKKVLWGSMDPDCDTAVLGMDYKQLCRFVKRELATIAIKREPDEDDYRYLATRAGFVMGADAMRGTLASLEELAAFKAWFSGHVMMLKHIRKQFERVNPTLVCGFGVTREAAEAVLAPHPKGTFLLRFGSQGGILALSVRNAPGAAASVTHYSLNCAVLQQNGLEALLERNGAAEQLLDLATGLRHPRASVLDRSYLQMVDMAEARKRYKQEDRRNGSDEEESTPPGSTLAADVPPVGCPSGPLHALGGASMDPPGSAMDMADSKPRLSSGMSQQQQQLHAQRLAIVQQLLAQQSMGGGPGAAAKQQQQHHAATLSGMPLFSHGFLGVCSQLNPYLGSLASGMPPGAGPAAAAYVPAAPLRPHLPPHGWQQQEQQVQQLAAAPASGWELQQQRLFVQQQQEHMTQMLLEEVQQQQQQQQQQQGLVPQSAGWGAPLGRPPPHPDTSWLGPHAPSGGLGGMVAPQAPLQVLGLNGGLPVLSSNPPGMPLPLARPSATTSASASPSASLSASGNSGTLAGAATTERAGPRDAGSMQPGGLPLGPEGSGTMPTPQSRQGGQAPASSLLLPGQQPASFLAHLPATGGLLYDAFCMPQGMHPGADAGLQVTSMQDLLSKQKLEPVASQGHALQEGPAHPGLDASQEFSVEGFLS